MLRILDESESHFGKDGKHYYILWAVQDDRTVNERTWVPASYVDAKVIQQWNAWKEKKHLFEPFESLLVAQMGADLICTMIRNNVARIFTKIVCGKW